MERRAVRCVKVAECVINVPLFARILVSKKKMESRFFPSVKNCIQISRVPEARAHGNENIDCVTLQMNVE